MDVTASAKDDKAKVSVSSPNLIPNGTTNVTVTVTAENGSKKTYTIQVTREQDPNYVASNNNNLSGIKVDGFLLSPGFTPENTNYVIWLPYETDTVKISGSSADKKASVEVIGGDNLLAGQDNEIRVVCTAEDGTKKEYVIVAKRAAAHDGSVDEIPSETSSAPVEEESSVAADTSIPTENNEPAGGLAWWWLIVVGAITLCVGAAGGFIIGKKKPADEE